MRLNTIEEAIAELKAGKIIIVVDDEDRENEGDFICPAQTITAEQVNFMTKYGRGLICTPITESRCRELELDMMVHHNTATHETQFTVSVDLLGNGCTTGISALDRAKTIAAIANPETLPSELGRPGHIFPLRAKNGGVLRRSGHTEAGVDLTRLAGLYPAAVLVEILNEDGTMARLPQLLELAQKYGMKIISIADLIKYRLKNDRLIVKEESVMLPTQWGDFELIAYRQIDNDLIHIALKKGEWQEGEPILCRVHSSCITGDIFASCKCDCGDQLHQAMMTVEQAGKGLILYMNQEGRGIGFINKLKAYHLQAQGRDTYQANEDLGFKADERDYGIGAQILKDLHATNLRLMSNNPVKRAGIEGHGIKISETVPIIIEPNQHNYRYLKTKQDKMGHELQIK